MTTIGDRVLNISLPKIGEKSLFTKDLEDALKTGGVDLVVHSLKDLPTALPDGMAIGAILEREDPRDALVLRKEFKGKTLDSLPTGSVIGTSSLRRSAQLSRTYPHLKVCDVRGNLNTRLAKLDAADSPMSGLLLAKAGLVRMGWKDRVDQTLDCATSLYAIGQGALAVECRANDPVITEMIAPLTHRDTLLRVLAERSFLKTLGGGCSAPVAISSKLHKSSETNNLQLTIKGAVWSLDGKTMLEDTLNINIVSTNNTQNVIDLSPEEKRLKTGDLNEDQKENGSDNRCPKSNNNDAGSRPHVKKISQADQNETVDKETSSNVVKISCPVKEAEGLKSCPHVKKIAKRALSSDCPLALPVGQDFMGQCPFLEAGHMQNIAKCPYKINENSDELCCPLRSNTNEGLDKTFLNVLAGTSSGSMQLDKCPFLAKNEVKTVEYVENNSNCNKIVCDSQQNLDIYCGILEHKIINKSLMEKCESLGRQLADILIKNGAMDVMKCAQLQIRSS